MFKMNTATKFNCNLAKQLQDNVIHNCNRDLPQKFSPHDDSQGLNSQTYTYKDSGSLINYLHTLLMLTKVNLCLIDIGPFQSWHVILIYVSSSKYLET